MSPFRGTGFLGFLLLIPGVSLAQSACPKGYDQISACHCARWLPKMNPEAEFKELGWAEIAPDLSTMIPLSPAPASCAPPKAEPPKPVASPQKPDPKKPVPATPEPIKPRFQLSYSYTIPKTPGRDPRYDFGNAIKGLGPLTLCEALAKADAFFKDAPGARENDSKGKELIGYDVAAIYWQGGEGDASRLRLERVCVSGVARTLGLVPAGVPECRPCPSKQ